MDVLTDLFSEMYLSGEVVARFDLAGSWGIAMPPQSGIFHAIAEGGCWVRLAPDGELFQVSAGDLIIFPEGIMPCTDVFVSGISKTDNQTGG